MATEQELKDGDPIELRRHLVSFGSRFHGTAPTAVLEALRALLVEFDEWGVPIARPAPLEPPPAPAPPPPAPPAPPAEPVRVPIRVAHDDAGNVTVHAKTPEAEPAVRSLKTILDVLAKRPLGRMSTAIFEVAVHVEALELEAEELRRQIAALSRR